MPELFSSLESQYGLPGGLLDSVWNAESSRGRNLRDSSAGAQGHFQFMPATARQYGVADPNDLVQSATGAARMFHDLLNDTGGDINRALAGYNWGIGNVQRKGMENAPAETRNYIQKVTAGMDPSTLAPGMANLQARAKTEDDDPLAAAMGAKPPKPTAKPAATDDDPLASAMAVSTPTKATPRAAPAEVAPPSFAEKAATAVMRVTNPFAAAALKATNTPTLDFLSNGAAGIASGAASIGNTLLNGGVKQAQIMANPVEMSKRAFDAITGAPEVTGPPKPEPLQGLVDWNKAREAGIKSFDKEHNDSLAFQGSRMLTQGAMTYPLGGMIAKPIQALAGSTALSTAAPQVANWLGKLGTAVETAGGTTKTAAEIAAAKTAAAAAPKLPLAAQLADVGTRATGGAITGAAQAGAIDPHEAGMGAAVGAGMPVAFAAISKLGGEAAVNKIVQTWREYRTPAAELKMKALMEATGLKDPDAIEAALKAYRTQFGGTVKATPSIATVVGDNPELAQLERTMYEKGNRAVIESQKNFRDAGRNALGDIRPGALGETPADAAVDFGNVAGPQIRGANLAAKENVNQLFAPLNDPTNTMMPRTTLPLMQMQGAMEKTIGPMSFGQGGAARTALDIAERHGSEANPAYAAWVEKQAAQAAAEKAPKPLVFPTLEGADTPQAGLFTPPKAPTAQGAPMTLEQAVRKAGGINKGGDYAGELAILHQDIAGITRNGKGKSIDQMASLMHEQGYIPDENPDTLLNMLRDTEHRKTVATENMGDMAERRMAEHQQREYEAWLEHQQEAPKAPEAPTPPPEAPAAPTAPAAPPPEPLGPQPPMTRDKAVAFSDVKQYRDSLSASVRAAAPGSPERAALVGMRAELDKHLDALAAGKLGPNDYYPPEMQRQWQQARQAHFNRQSLYANDKTAPIASVATRIGEKQDPSLAYRFYRAGPMGETSMQEFNRLGLGENTRGLLQDVAISQMGGLNRGSPTGSSLLDYMNKRSPAIGQLFNTEQQGKLQTIAGALKRQEDVLALGKAKGSPTFQLFQSQLLEDPALNAGWMNSLANMVPTKTGRGIANGILGGMREGARARNAEMIGQLTTDPELFIKTMRDLQKRSLDTPLLNNASPTALGTFTRKTIPTLLAQ